MIKMLHRLYKDYRACSQLIRSLKKPLVTILGSGHPQLSEKRKKQAYDTGYTCAQAGYSLLTGGGPGVMNEVNRAAYDYHKQHNTYVISAGIGVEGIDDDFACPACQQFVRVASFCTRKEFLLRYCTVCVVLPGGSGTMDELWHLLNYKKHGKTQCQRLIFIDTLYWDLQLQWLDVAIKKEYIKLEIVPFYSATDVLLPEMLQIISEGI